MTTAAITVTVCVLVTICTLYWGQHCYVKCKEMEITIKLLKDRIEDLKAFNASLREDKKNDNKTTS